jgi:hypothetical protein
MSIRITRTGNSTNYLLDDGLKTMLDSLRQKANAAASRSFSATAAVSSLSPASSSEPLVFHNVRPAKWRIDSSSDCMYRAAHLIRSPFASEKERLYNQFMLKATNHLSATSGLMQGTSKFPQDWQLAFSRAKKVTDLPQAQFPFFREILENLFVRYKADAKHRNFLSYLQDTDKLYKSLHTISWDFIQKLMKETMHTSLEEMQEAWCTELYNSLSQDLESGFDLKDVPHLVENLRSKQDFAPALYQWCALKAFSECGFQIDSWHPSDPFAVLVSHLQKRGPLLSTCNHGFGYYVNQPIKAGYTINGQEVHGWPVNAPKVPQNAGHTAVIVGAETRDGKNVVYYLDPLHPDTLLRKSYEAFAKECTPLSGFQIAAYVVYNPNWLKAQAPAVPSAAAAGGGGAATAETVPEAPAAAASST